MRQFEPIDYSYSRTIVHQGEIYYSQVQASRYLGVSPERLQRLLRKHHRWVRTYRAVLGNRLYISKVDLDWIRLSEQMRKEVA